MKKSAKEISEQFSQGNFPFCYEYFCDDVQWHIVGADTIKSKPNVIAYCDKMMIEISSSKLVNTHVISTNDDVVIEGYCDYTNADNVPCKLSYCDVYHFEGNAISGITSYCVDKKLSPEPAKKLV